MYLPIGHGADTQSTPAADPAPLAGEETVLIVDDEETLLRLAGKLLRKNGYKTLTAESGARGLELYREHQNDIAVVVLDLMMPGMDGDEVEQRLRDLNPDVKVVFSSGYSQDGMAAKLMAGKNRRFVQKPFEVSALCQAIRDLIDGA